MKGHRRKKSSVGPENLKGQGQALAWGLCCQEGGSESGARRGLSTNSTLLRKLPQNSVGASQRFGGLGQRMAYSHICTTRRGRAPGVPSVSLADGWAPAPSHGAIQGAKRAGSWRDHRLSLLGHKAITLLVWPEDTPYYKGCATYFTGPRLFRY